MKKILLLISILSFQSMAQDLKKSALENFSNQKWEAASKDYLKYLKKNDGDSSDWYNLAISKSRLEEYKEAITYFKKAGDKNFNRSFVTFGIAKSYALLEDETNALASLKDGAENGFAASAALLAEPAFDSYKDMAEFQSIIEKVELNAYPCLNSENYRHFDFWIGEWDVYANGNKVGENSITRAKGGCAIHENYTTARTYAGQSINFFDPIDKKWHQHWVGSSGDTYNYLEVDRGPGMLQFESKFMNPNGQISLSRLTFTLRDDGTVRQLFEGSTDDGKTWTPAFDGIYKRKE